MAMARAQLQRLDEIKPSDTLIVCLAGLGNSHREVGKMLGYTQQNISLRVKKAIAMLDETSGVNHQQAKRP